MYMSKTRVELPSCMSQFRTNVETMAQAKACAIGLINPAFVQSECFG